MWPHSKDAPLNYCFSRRAHVFISAEEEKATAREDGLTVCHALGAELNASFRNNLVLFCVCFCDFRLHTGRKP